MDRELPDRATIEAALALAVRAPSVHNSQPWRWRIGDESVHLYADPARHLPHVDPERRDLMLSCGVALHHFTVALSALGWATDVHRFPNPADPDHLASVAILGPARAEQDIALAAAIPRRRTDRRWFSSWPVPTGDIALMAARAARSGVTLRRVEDTGELAQVVAHAVREHISDPAYLAELSMWSGRHGTPAGVPARSTPPADRRGMFAPRVFANPVLEQPSDIEPRDDAGVVLVLATATDDPSALLRAGEATSIVLLTATALGLASCPLTEPLEVEATRTELRTKLLGGDGFPQMLLRVGWAALNADPLPATPRRPLSDVAASLAG
ncbi:nitroreductase [Mycolicibacterium sp. BK556]|uniref:Acg family FMN-binding oxidoreductase n=1 Tax=unclassified Mycolicibacterium TaxID=2636767 RepID=UPI001621993A|nr:MULTISPECIES: nitroreductase family protein [unclassified Mycolicibacterium]MBB3604014.1 nitroreductase [Mycolicibacterium sp. BK556]MBB3634210.1 nitroreductase [Mycolicibacterium sp. BK607]